MKPPSHYACWHKQYRLPAWENDFTVYPRSAPSFRSAEAGLLYHNQPPLVKTLAQGSSALKAEFEEYNFMGTELPPWHKSTTPSGMWVYALSVG
jgi:hypothetical protein